jgi:FMN phosphatase YigB (HAD superfamily)
MIDKQVVIFDLGGVLLREAEVNLDKVDNKNLKSLFATSFSETRIFNRAFEFASLFCGDNCKNEWILGTISGQNIVKKTKENIDKIEHDKFFKSEHEKSLIKYGIEFVLIPELLIELTEIIDEGFEFVKKCKDNNIKLAIISNWDPESFKLIKVKFPEFFKLFNEQNIIIPSMLGKTKPCVEIYDYAVKKINSEISNCFFVDDSKINVEGAQKAGIKSVHHQNWKETKEKLVELGLKIK